MKKNLLFVAGLLLATANISAQDNTWHDPSNCLLLPAQSGTYTVVDDPDAGITGSATRLDSGVHFNLEEPITDITDFDFSVQAFQSVAGNRFQIQFYNSTLGTGDAGKIFVGNFSMPETENTWKTITVNLSGTIDATTLANGGYNRLYLTGVSDTGSPITYFKELKGDPNVHSAPLSDTAVLASGNKWYYDDQSTIKDATPSGGNVTVTEEFAVTPATPLATGTASDHVLKLERGSGPWVYGRFLLTGAINSPYTQTIKFRIFADCNTSSEAKILFSLTDSESPGNDGQKTAVSTTFSQNKWTEFEIDLSTLNAGQVVGDLSSYDRINIFLNPGDSSGDADGNVYYIDALQGPEEGTTLLAVNNSTRDNETLELYPNPAENTIKLSENSVNTKIYNITGKLMTAFSGTTKSFDVSSYTKGIYLMYIETENGASIVRRFVKN